MKLGTLFTINAVVAVIFGLAFLLAPEILLSYYGAKLGIAGTLIGRFFGGTLIGYGLLTWLARNAEASEARNAIVTALFISNAIGVIVALIGPVSGIVNTLGWSTVVIYLLFTIGYGYFQLSKPSS